LELGLIFTTRIGTGLYFLKELRPGPEFPILYRCETRVGTEMKKNGFFWRKSVIRIKN
jgi:hypothetical protein